jgi:hypothetical protein
MRAWARLGTLSRRCVLALACVATVGCGGGGDGEGGGGAGTPLPPFTFRWFAVVDSITDGDSLPATMVGVQVGDVLVAHVDYDPAAFAAGVNVSGDGLDYGAPAGLLMHYAFTSGGQFTKVISDVRVRDGGSFDQWNWDGGDFGGLLFQLNDPSDAAFTLPLGAQFATSHAQFRAAVANFDFGGAPLVFPAPADADVRNIELSVTGFVLLPN